MTGSKSSTRRAFFLQGGAALGAGVATTAGAVAAPGDAVSPEEQLKQLRRELGCATDRDAIRQLHRTFAALIEQRRYTAAADLFDEQGRLDLSGVSASGKAAIVRLFAQQYGRQQAAVLHGSYRQSPLQPGDALTVDEDGLRATATFHIEVELCAPLPDDCTAARMARLQGQVDERRWETGRLEGQYVKTRGDWRIASLIYRA
jgi:hypothetical protein